MTRAFPLFATALITALAGAAAPAAAEGEWGALALSERTTGYGYAFDHESQEAATARAMAECARVAGDCRVHTTFRNTCLILAGSPDGPFGWAWGGAEATRAQRAIEQCRQRGAGRCRVVETVCTGTAGGPATPRNPVRGPDQPSAPPPGPPPSLTQPPAQPPPGPAATSPPPAPPPDVTRPPGAPTPLHRQ
jgi:hypothetical protein